MRLQVFLPDHKDFLQRASHVCTIHAMGQSPFHGIFSALQQDGKDRGAFGFGSTSSQQQHVPASASPPPAQSTVGRVAVDIFELDEYYIIKAPIAGVRLSDLDIEVNENVITIRGNRRQTDMVPPEGYILQECFWGPFARSVTLPIIVNPQKIRATFNKECILKILIPKEEKVKIVKISEV